ncbi:peptidyl-prolyl cis-trans isomerase fkbp12 [Phtheirospermum japonicum]|uniref:peptidylprolyl isomerase n=1 Tax=Phtheirospermum japonicum TaxID=374723 RepID=A0A830BWE5_9LAMI|nr:peptidyl-prolyl cis-trans isomerase fkbp12 [Phtheirospermum japonicum]
MSRYQPETYRAQNVTVHCTGFGKNGNLAENFWSTKDLGHNPFPFQIGQGNVIKGWDEVRNASRRSCPTTVHTKLCVSPRWFSVLGYPAQLRSGF